jgi:hypothetical protein
VTCRNFPFARPGPPRLNPSPRVFNPRGHPGALQVTIPPIFMEIRLLDIPAAGYTVSTSAPISLPERMRLRLRPL